MGEQDSHIIFCDLRRKSPLSHYGDVRAAKRFLGPVDPIILNKTKLFRRLKA